ncbi:MAG: type VI secretion system baseplate subunit TssK [Gammaproteobacteria bacterium]|nr:MAG: type VI secretion system baseplate subunit TssK [Gammaproteobacteria bacterium]
MESVVWSEGLLLTPQHFQMQDRFHRQELHARAGLIQPDAWGVVSLDVSHPQLEAGLIELTRLQALMPDGTRIDVAGQEARQLAIEVTEAPQTIWLVLPAGGRFSLHESNENAPRKVIWREVQSEVEDGGAIEEVAVSVPQSRLSATPPDTAQVAMPLLRVESVDSQGRLVLDTAFLPPVLNANTFEATRAALNELLTLLEKRSRQLATLIQRSRVSVASRVNETLALTLINQACCMGRHALTRPTQHLHGHFQWLLPLYAGLASLSGKSVCDQALPEYVHEAPAEHFHSLLRDIRAMLASVYQPSATAVELKASKPGWHLATFRDAGQLQGVDLVLAIRADAGAAQVARIARQQLKVAAPGALRDLVSLQLPGMSLNPLQVIPADLPTLSGYQYFEVVQEGRLWKDVREESALGVHVSGEVQGLEMALWTIRRANVSREG